MKELWRVINLLFIPKFELHCGHVGVAGTMTMKEERAFQDLLVVDVIRGPDATGIAAFNRKDGINVVKKALLPNELFQMEQTKKLFRVFNQVLLGHNRWATQGKVNHVNSHPFEFGSIVGAHNGTLVNQTLLPDSETFEVDSENLIHSIQKIGIAETYKLLHGAAALVWFDEDTYELNFLRNDERPMFLTYSKDRKTMFWASEAWMLRGVLAKNGIEHTDVFNTAIDTHYRVRIPQWDDPLREGEKHKSMTFDKMEAKVLTPYDPPKKSQSRFPNGKADTTTKGSGSHTTTTTKDGGVYEKHYQQGDEVYFFLNHDSPTDKRYIECLDSQHHDQIVRVYCHKKSWLRRRMEGMDDNLYMGIVNGYVFGDTGDGVVCQSNSIEEIDKNDIEWGSEDNTQLDFDDDIPFNEEEFSLEAREHQTRVIKSAGYVCGICSEKVQIHPENYCLSDNTIICSDCRGTPFAQELIDAY